MNFSTLRSQINKIPVYLRELDQRFGQVTCANCARPEFYQWYQEWYKSVEDELALVIDELKQLQEEAYEAKLTTLEARQAAKDSIDMEVLIDSLRGQLGSMSASITQQMRYAYLWRVWETKVSPMGREVDIASRKFQIALAGL